MKPASPMERMSGADAMMLYLDRPRAYNHTIKMSILDITTEEWSWPRFKQAMASRIVLIPRLRQRYLSVPLGLNHPVWIDDPDFNVDCHIKRIACPAPGGMHELCELTAELYAQRLDHTRALWQMWVIEGLEGGRICALLLIHHAITDGGGFINFLNTFWNTKPESLAYPVQTQWNPAPLPSNWRLLFDGLRDLPGVLRKNLPGAIRGIQAGRRLRREMQQSGHEPAPGMGSPGFAAPFACQLSSRRSYAAHPYPLEKIKRISKTLGATINDVFLACTAGALRRYLIDRNGSAPQQAMLATVPFSLIPPEQRTLDGNFSTVDYTVLHTQLEDPLERLNACRESAQIMKAHFEATREASLAALLNLLPPVVPKLLDRLNESKGGGLLPFWNLVVSNVAGPRKRLHVGSLELAEWYSIGQIAHGAALNITGWSYVDTFNVCILTDTEVVADPWLLIDAFSVCLDELDQVALARATPPSSESPVQVNP
jgi:WS/DGAT/MGAT family acyltransferase